METKVQRITEWCKENGVKMNHHKTQLILNTFVKGFSIAVNGTEVKATQEARCFGVDFCSDSTSELLRFDFSSLLIDVQEDYPTETA